MKRLGALVVIAIVLAGCSGDPARLVVGAGTTLVDSGVMAEVETAYEAAHPEVDVVIVAGDSGSLLRLGESGDVDVVITHAPALELESVARGATRTSAFTGRFVLVGPEGDPLTATAVVAAFAEIGDIGRTFVSRGDDSGTAEAERTIWAEAGIDPVGSPWYLVTGSGMGFTLQVADQRQAFTLVDEATWLSSRTRLVEVPLAEHPLLANAYSALTFHDEAIATAFASWIAGPDGFAVVDAATRSLFGASLYRP